MDNKTISTAITNTIRGVEVKSLIPEVGMGWGHSVGSDYYGGTIDYVSPDKSWFHCDKGGGFAKLVTRKNSIHCGRYIHAYLPDCWESDSDYHTDISKLDMSDYEKFYKQLKAEKVCYAVRCSSNCLRYVCEKPQQDELDPSF